MERAEDPTRRLSARHLALLVVGVLGVSSSAVLIREADAPSFAVGFWRNAFAALALAPFAIAQGAGAWRALPVARRRAVLAAGVALGVHFALWIPSVELTSVAASTVLVTTAPVWVAILGRVTLGERIGRRGSTGIALALAGAIVISGGDLGTGTRAALGDLLALAGALAAACYVVLGRDVRPYLPLAAYACIVYVVAAAILGVLALLTGSALTGFETGTWLLLLGMAAGPQLLGHTVFNYLLADIEAWVIALTVTAEPVIASLLAFVILGERPGALLLAGGAVILVGIGLALTARSRPAEIAPE